MGEAREIKGRRAIGDQVKRAKGLAKWNRLNKTEPEREATQNKTKTKTKTKNKTKGLKLKEKS